MYSFPYLEIVCSMSSSNCCLLNCTQISQEAGQVVWHFHLFKNFPQFIVIHTVKGFGIVNKAEIDVFLELSYFFHEPADVGNLISGSSAFSKTSLNIRKFTVHILLKAGLENFEQYFTSVWDECNCGIVCAFFGLAFLWDWNENWPFPVLWPLLSFPNLLAYWVQLLWPRRRSRNSISKKCPECNQPRCPLTWPLKVTFPFLPLSSSPFSIELALPMSMPRLFGTRRQRGRLGAREKHKQRAPVGIGSSHKIYSLTAHMY